MTIRLAENIAHRTALSRARLSGLQKFACLASLRQIGYDERVHKLESLHDSVPRFH